MIDENTKQVLFRIQIKPAFGSGKSKSFTVKGKNSEIIAQRIIDLFKTLDECEDECVKIIHYKD